MYEFVNYIQKLPTGDQNLIAGVLSVYITVWNDKETN